MARRQLGGQGQPGATAPPGYAAEPQAGPVPGYAAEPQAGPVPGYGAQPQAGPVPGYAAQPQAGPVSGRRPGRGFGVPGSSPGDAFSLGDDLADIAMTQATRLIGGAIGRRIQRALDQQVLPALAARGQAMLRTQIAIAERHPDLRACTTDKVIFLAGGSRALPLKDVNIATLTVEQSDALVAQLRDG